MKLVREFAVAVALEPIVIAEARADLLDRGAQRLLEVCEREVDRGYSAVGMSARSVAWIERQRNPGVACPTYSRAGFDQSGYSL
jgi:hypothetical protein